VGWGPGGAFGSFDAGGVCPSDVEVNAGAAMKAAASVFVKRRREVRDAGSLLDSPVSFVALFSFVFRLSLIS
jgi:hypothetical protein